MERNRKACLSRSAGRCFLWTGLERKGVAYGKERKIYEQNGICYGLHRFGYWIWMFPYRLGAYGGAAFLIPYFLFVLILGTTGLITEFAFGRAFGGGSMTGISEVFRERTWKGGKIVGMLPAIGLLGIFMFYNVVVGWI